MQASVKWVKDGVFQGTSDSGHGVLMDTDSESPIAPSPMEYVLMSAGSCSSIDVISILQKARQNVSDCEVKLTGERAETAPRVFTKMHLHFIITGTDVGEKHVERAVSLSADKYCSVALMLNGKVDISHSFEIVSR